MANARQMIGRLLAWGIGGVFIYAGALKFMHPAALLANIEGYRLVPYHIAWLGAVLLPALELVCGAALFSRIFRREAATILWLLIVVFMVALASAWWREIDVSCGCFGVANAQAKYPLLIGRDLLLWAGLVAVILLESKARPKAGSGPTG